MAGMDEELLRNLISSMSRGGRGSSNVMDIAGLAEMAGFNPKTSPQFASYVAQEGKMQSFREAESLSKGFGKEDREALLTSMKSDINLLFEEFRRGQKDLTQLRQSLRDVNNEYEKYTDKTNEHQRTIRDVTQVAGAMQSFGQGNVTGGLSSMLSSFVGNNPMGLAAIAGLGIAGGVTSMMTQDWNQGYAAKLGAARVGMMGGGSSQWRDYDMTRQGLPLISPEELISSQQAFVRGGGGGPSTDNRQLAALTGRMSEIFGEPASEFAKSAALISRYAPKLDVTSSMEKGFETLSTSTKLGLIPEALAAIADTTRRFSLSSVSFGMSKEGFDALSNAVSYISKTSTFEGRDAAQIAGGVQGLSGAAMRNPAMMAFMRYGMGMSMIETLDPTRLMRGNRFEEMSETTMGTLNQMFPGMNRDISSVITQRALEQAGFGSLATYFGQRMQGVSEDQLAHMKGLTGTPVSTYAASENIIKEMGPTAIAKAMTIENSVQKMAQAVDGAGNNIVIFNKAVSTFTNSLLDAGTRITGGIPLKTPSSGW